MSRSYLGGCRTRRSRGGEKSKSKSRRSYKPSRNDSKIRSQLRDERAALSKIRLFSGKLGRELRSENRSKSKAKHNHIYTIASKIRRGETVDYSREKISPIIEAIRELNKKEKAKLTRCKKH